MLFFFVLGLRIAPGFQVQGPRFVARGWLKFRINFAAVLVIE